MFNTFMHCFYSCVHENEMKCNELELKLWFYGEYAYKIWSIGAIFSKRVLYLLYSLDTIIFMIIHKEKKYFAIRRRYIVE